MALPVERICSHNVNLTSPVDTEDGLYLVAANGDIFKYRDGQLKLEYNFGGQPSGIAFDNAGFLWL